LKDNLINKDAVYGKHKIHIPLSHASMKRIPTVILCLRPAHVTPPYNINIIKVVPFDKLLTGVPFEMT
jgi:hypothetical protein